MNTLHFALFIRLVRIMGVNVYENTLLVFIVSSPPTYTYVLFRIFSAASHVPMENSFYFFFRYNFPLEICPFSTFNIINSILPICILM